MDKTTGTGRAVMRKEARIARLQEAVTLQKSLHIRDAAELLDVSEMTIRRDIRENQGTFEFLGGHIVSAKSAGRPTLYDHTHASEQNEAAKRAACQACVPLLRAKETIFVDCGTTLPHLVSLVPNDMELTIVCYALNIADMAVRKPNIKLVLLGGAYHAPTASFYPIEEDSTLSSFSINTAFMSAAGVDERLGATCTTFREATLKRAAMARSQQRVLVIDETKFGTVKPACFANVDAFDLILTENGVIETTSSIRAAEERDSEIQ